MQLKDKQIKPAGRVTLTRSRYRFDAAVMMLRRHYNNHPGLRRQLLFDASPQKGVEIFACTEIVHTGNPNDAQNRRLPLTTLGVGHFSAIDKAMALLHSLGLEAGFNHTYLRHACCAVRCMLPDAGADHLITEFPDITNIFLAGALPPSDLSDLHGTHVLPFPFWIHEPNHVHDLVVKTVLWSIPWWPSHYEDTRDLVQFLRVTSNREVLKLKAKKENWLDDAKRLSVAPTSILNLRWGTVCSCSADLVKQAAALYSVFSVALFPAS